MKSCGGEEEVVNEGKNEDDKDEKGERERERVMGMKMTVMRRS